MENKEETMTQEEYNRKVQNSKIKRRKAFNDFSRNYNLLDGNVHLLLAAETTEDESRNIHSVFGHPTIIEILLANYLAYKTIQDKNKSFILGVIKRTREEIKYREEQFAKEVAQNAMRQAENEGANAETK